MLLSQMPFVITCEVKKWPVVQAEHRTRSLKSTAAQHRPSMAFAQQRGPDISRLAPALCDTAAKSQLGNTNKKPRNGNKAGCTRDQCLDGHHHSWSATVFQRTSGSGCPQCRGRKVCKHNCLATKALLVAAQWACEENIGLSNSVTAQSHQPASWHCDICGHN